MRLQDGKEKKSLIRSIKEKRTIFFTDENARDVMAFIFSFAIVHTVFMMEFYLAGIKEMFLYNIGSVLFFLMIVLLLFTKEKVNYMAIDILVSCEIILHQVLAVYFIGLVAGFQYIILGLAMPVIFYSLQNLFTIITIIKAGVSLFVFLACDYLYKFRLTPVYEITDEKWLTFSYYVCILCLFASLAKGAIGSYTKYKVQLKKEYQFHKDVLEKQAAMQQNVIQTIADIVEARDETTGLHTERTKEYVLQILHKLKGNDKYKEYITERYIREVSNAAVLHDIGKIKIPDAILKKPAKLTNEEFEVIKTHSQEGANLLAMCAKSFDDESYYRIAKNIALYHHERWDGKGYPQQLSKEEIPLEARIMSIADVFDALMSKRPYKEKFDKETALNIMREGRGTQFDPDIFDCFVECAENLSTS